jgi:hypothetical protein
MPEKGSEASRCTRHGALLAFILSVFDDFFKIFFIYLIVNILERIFHDTQQWIQNNEIRGVICVHSTQTHSHV